jgi:ribonuclease HI
MSGAFKAVSSPALNIKMYLLPIEEQIWKHNTAMIGRMNEAVDTRQSNTTNIRMKRGSPRETIMMELQHIPSPDGRQREHVKPFIVPPWWQGPRTYIDSSSEKAQKEHRKKQQRETNAIHIYTDGSGINGGIGAAAVSTTTNETASAYMGADTTSTVYAGELQGIILALRMAAADRAKGNNRSKLLIYTDNQAAIRSSAKPKGKSGAYLLSDIAQRTQQLSSLGLPIEVQWIPAHVGIQGNEDADKAGHRVVRNRTGRPSS